MRTTNAFPGLIFIVVFIIGAAISYLVHNTGNMVAGVVIFTLTIICAALISSSIRVADQWTKGVILRLGKFRWLDGPGLFFIIPIIDTIPYWINTRVLTSSFKAEKTLTKDTVPVDVDAVLFWQIVDPKMAALNVADYQSAIFPLPKLGVFMNKTKPYGGSPTNESRFYMREVKNVCDQAARAQGIRAKFFDAWIPDRVAIKRAIISGGVPVDSVEPFKDLWTEIIGYV